MVKKVTVSRDDLIAQITFFKKQNAELLNEIAQLKEQVKPPETSGELDVSTEIVVKHNKSFKIAKVDMNLDTGEARVAVNRNLGKEEYRALYEGKRVLVEYLTRVREK